MYNRSIQSEYAYKCVFFKSQVITVISQIVIEVLPYRESAS